MRKIEICLAFAATVWLIAGCTVTHGPVKPAGITLNEGTIIYSGLIGQTSTDRFAALLKSSGNQVTTLRIESGGGDVEAAMRMGALVFDHGLDIEIFGDGCHSSCANYVFPAGRNKLIERGALVSWHGSAIQTEWNMPRGQTKQEFAEALAPIRQMQYDYFRRLGVDERVTIVGHDLNCRCIWVLSAEDMARFGIDNIVVAGDLRSALGANEYMSGIRFLDLPEDVLDRIRPPRTSAPRSQTTDHPVQKPGNAVISGGTAVLDRNLT